MKKLFFTLCALCLCGTMWANPSGGNYQYDLNRPANDSGEIYQDATTGIYFYLKSGSAVLTYANDADANDNAYVNSSWTSGYSFEGTLVIPATVQAEDGEVYNVTEIGRYAFYHDTGITGTLSIPANITSLDISCFEGTQLTEVIIEESDVELTNENNQLYGGAFYASTTITKVTVNRNITEGRSYGSGYRPSAFTNLTALKEVSFGEKVTNVVHDLFYGCSAITTVYCYATSVPELGTDAFASITKADCTLHVYESLLDDFNASDWADQFSNIVSMDDPDVEVGTFKDTVTGLYFKDYDGTYVSIIADEMGTYNNSNLVDYEGELAYLAEGAKTIPQYVYDEDGNAYPVDRIDTEAFYGAEIEGHLVIPAYINYMGTSAFEDCIGLTAVTYEYSATPLSEEDDHSDGTGMSFQGCSKIETVNMFRNFNMTSATRHLAPFEYDNAITTVNIGPRVTAIPAFMFRNTSDPHLTTVNCYALEVPSTRYDPFANIATGCVLNVPAGLVDTYAAASYAYSSYESQTWGGFFGEGNIKVMDNAFAITTHANNDGTAYATFYNSGSNVELFDGELTAYEATTLEDEGLVIDIVEIGNVIPKATGVVVETATEGTYLAIATTEEANSATNNHLYGFDTATQCSQGDNYLYYLLSSYNGEVGFYWGAEDGAAFICQAHRAYLALEQGSGSQGISIRKGNGGEDTTGISSVENAVEGATVKGIYTIQGVRVSNMNQPGLYIVDGKKVLVK